MVYVFLVPHLSLRMVDLNAIICEREMLRGVVWSCGVICGFWLGVVDGWKDGVGLEVCVRPETATPTVGSYLQFFHKSLNFFLHQYALICYREFSECVVFTLGHDHLSWSHLVGRLSSLASFQPFLRAPPLLTLTGPTPNSSLPFTFTHPQL